MEQEGIYYFFRHEQGRHVLVLADAYGAHTTVPGYGSVPYYPKNEQQRERDHIHDWHLAQEVQPGSLELNDRSEEHTSELQSLMRISYAVFCLKKQQNINTHIHQNNLLYSIMTILS